jgi:hypothetical protein
MLLLVYWFRYTCLIVLRTKPVLRYATKVATANQLNVLLVQEQLASNGQAEFDDLRQMLERDYRLVTFLIENGANFRPSGFGIESFLLKADFQLMRAFYATSRRLSPSQCRSALKEMAEIVSHFADAMGESAAHANAR